MVGIVENRKEMLDKIRKKMSERGNRRNKDEHEFRIPKAQANEELNFYFRVLPELSKDEKCESGIASREYEFFFYPNGAHWMDRQKVECPRLHDGDKCNICQLGFDLLSETSDEKGRSEISRKFLPRTYYALNVYFLDTNKNPEEVRGKVMWMSVPKTVYDIFDACMHSDDPGDDEDPKAYGMFYDVVEGFLFKLTVTKKGDWNTYEASRFLPGKGPSPIVKGKKGEPDVDRIKEILDQRHDLVLKFESRDTDKIASIVKKLLNDGDEDSGFDKDEEEPKPKSKTKPKKKVEEEIVEEDAGDDVDKSSSDDVEEDSKVDEMDDDEELANLLDTIKGKK